MLISYYFGETTVINKNFPYSFAIRLEIRILWILHGLGHLGLIDLHLPGYYLQRFLKNSANLVYTIGLVRI